MRGSAGALASAPDLDSIEEDFRDQWREDLAEHHNTSPPSPNTHEVRTMVEPGCSSRSPASFERP